MDPYLSKIGGTLGVPFNHQILRRSRSSFFGIFKKLGDAAKQYCSIIDNITVRLSNIPFLGISMVYAHKKFPCLVYVRENFLGGYQMCENDYQTWEKCGGRLPYV